MERPPLRSRANRLMKNGECRGAKPLCRSASGGFSTLLEKSGPGQKQVEADDDGLARLPVNHLKTPTRGSPEEAK